MNAQGLIEQVEHAFDVGEREASKITPEVIGIHGYSSPTIRHFFNELCSFDECRFCEVGSFCGATVIAAAFRNPGYHTSIDNFSFEPEVSKSAQRLPANIERFKADSSIDLMIGDCFDVVEKLPDESINVFTYDGFHSEGCTAYSLVKFRRVLTSPCIVFMDDYKWDKVRKGTAAGLELGRWKVIREWEKESPGLEDIADPPPWWNGVWVGVLEKK